MWSIGTRLNDPCFRGVGFVGCNFVYEWSASESGSIVVADQFTYEANPENFNEDHVRAGARFLRLLNFW